MPKAYHGVIPPIITPVDANEDVEEEGFRALLEHCVRGGLHGIFVAGTNGEAMALTQRERNRAIRIALSQVNGRVPVVCGVMDSGTRRVIENIHAIEEMGAACAAVTSIFYARHTSQEETVRHFDRIARETSVDLIVYNMPSMTGLQLSAETVKRLAGIERVKAYKDSSPAYGDFLAILAATRDTPFACLQGMTAHAVSALRMGADGFVPALAPLFPELFADAYRAGRSGSLEEALLYDGLLRESSKILALSKNMTAAAKCAIATLGLTGPRVIAPQDGVSPEEAERIRAQVERVRGLYAKVKEGGKAHG